LGELRHPISPDILLFSTLDPISGTAQASCLNCSLFTADANDFLNQWESSAAFDPSPQLDRIKAASRPRR
jgi:hypothetical protein